MASPIRLSVLVFLLFAADIRTAVAASNLIVSFPSDGKMLLAYLYRPSGPGPYPAIIFQHGLHKGLITAPAAQFQKFADFFTSRGYLVFLPDRHAQAFETSEYPPDLQAKLASEPTSRAVLNETLKYRIATVNRDVVASVRWLKQQPDVVTNHVAMIGLFSGAMQALLAAPKGIDVQGIIAFSPAASTWLESPVYRELLIPAVRASKTPTFLIFTENNQSLIPAEMLGREVLAKGKPSHTKVYPAFGKPQEHGRFFLETGSGIWGPDVLQFLAQTLN